MGSLLVVPVDPLPDCPTCVLEVFEQVLPDALLLQAPEEALDHAVLFGSVGGDELLAETVVPDSRPEPATLEDESVVTPHNGGVPLGTQGTEAGDAGFFQSPLRFLGPPPEGELKAHDLSVVAVDDGGQVPPAVRSAVDVGDVHGPTLVASLRTTAKPTHSRTRSVPALVTEPAFHLQDAVDGLAVDEEAIAEAQDGPEPAVAEGEVLADELLDPSGEEVIRGRFLLSSRSAPAHGTAGHGEETTDSAFRSVREHCSHSSDVSWAKGRPFWASLRMSMSSTSSPTFCFSFLICSSFWASSSRGLVRSAFSAAERSFSRQSSTSATVRPCLRAASCAEVSPLMMLTINAERLLAVHRWTSSGSSSVMSTTSCQAFGFSASAYQMVKAAKTLTPSLDKAEASAEEIAE